MRRRNNGELGGKDARHAMTRRRPLTLRAPMEELREFVKDQQAIIAAVIAGTCAIVAAVIRRERSTRQPHETKPIFKLVLLSLFSIVLGGALLGAEYKVLPADPDKPLNLDNPG